MDDAFVHSLLQIKTACPERSIEAMFCLFGSIERMVLEDVVAAKRSLDLFLSLNDPLDDSAAKIVEAMDEALVTRASVIYKVSHDEATRNKEDRGVGKYTRFTRPLFSAFGETSYRERIERSKHFDIPVKHG